jgi:hypothetical protein
MNGSNLSTAAIPELVPATGIGGPDRPAATAGVATPLADVNRTPDAEVAIGATMVRVHAMFHVDPDTRRVQVSVVDENGHLIRLIPPDSVAQMLAAMASYPTHP